MDVFDKHIVIVHYGLKFVLIFKQSGFLVVFNLVEGREQGFVAPDFFGGKLQVLGGDGLEFWIYRAEGGLERLIFKFWVVEKISLPYKIFERGKGWEPEVVKQGYFFGSVGNVGVGSFNAFLQHGIDIGEEVV